MELIIVVVKLLEDSGMGGLLVISYVFSATQLFPVFVVFMLLWL